MFSEAGTYAKLAHMPLACYLATAARGNSCKSIADKLSTIMTGLFVRLYQLPLVYSLLRARTMSGTAAYPPNPLTLLPPTYQLPCQGVRQH